MKNSKLYFGSSWREKIFHWFLAILGRDHWSPFVRSMRHLGRQSPVAFPPELVNQGAELFLTGIANTLAFQSHASWVLPWWGERQMRPDSQAFIPSGVNILTMNLSSRNWTSIGNLDSPREAMVDPVGMLTPAPFSPSYLPYLRINGTHFVPQRLEKVNQKWINTPAMTLMTEYELEQPIKWSNECLAVRDHQGDWIVWTHKIKNTSDRSIALTFGIGIRPYNILSFAPIFRLRFKYKFWRVNRKASLFLPTEPDIVLVASRHGVDPLISPPEFAAIKGKSKSGWMVGQCEWEIHLETNQIWEFQCYVPLKLDIKASQIDIAHLNDIYLESRDKKTEIKGAKVLLPNSDWQKTTEILRKRWHIFDDGNHFSPGTFLYHQHWIRDSAFIAIAHDQWGLTEIVEPKIHYWLQRQRHDGEFRSQMGEWDSTGQCSLVVIRHLRQNPNPALLQKAIPKLQKAMLWIRNTRLKSEESKEIHAGLLPAGFSAEHFGPNDHYFWDNFWSLAAMEEYCQLLKDLEMIQDVNYWKTEIQDYRKVLSDIFNCMKDSWGYIMSSSPYRQVDAATIGTLALVSPLNLELLDRKWIVNSVEYLMQNHLREGLFYQPIFHTGFNIYLTAQLARALQVLGDQRWEALFESILGHASSTMSWPEAIHPRTGGGCMGDGDHGWALSECLCLIRNSLLREQDNYLVLLPNIPLGWWDLNREISFSEMNSLCGQLQLHKSEDSGLIKITWNLERNHLSHKHEIVLILPSIMRILDAEASEIAWNWPERRAWLLGDHGEIHIA